MTGTDGSGEGRAAGYDASVLVLSQHAKRDAVVGEARLLAEAWYGQVAVSMAHRSRTG